jgi:DNA topoisomerase-3
LKLPRALKTNSAICRAFLDQHSPSRSSGPGKPAPQAGPRPPSEAMVRYARSLAEQQGIECPPEVIADFAACRAFLDQHSRNAQNTPSKTPTRAPQSRQPAGSVGRSDNRRERIPARKPTEVRAKASRRRAPPRAATPVTDQ